MVYQFERIFVQHTSFMEKYREKTRPYGFKWTILLIGVYVALWLLADNVDPIFVWCARALAVFFLLSIAHDIMYKRVKENRSGYDYGSNERWR